MLPKNPLTALYLPKLFSLAFNAIKCLKWWKKLQINRQIKREIKFIERIQKIYAKWSKKYLREKEKRIQNPHERLWKRFKSIQREDLSRLLFQPWSRDLSKPSRDLQSTIILFSSIHSSVHPPWENPKRVSSFE